MLPPGYFIYYSAVIVYYEYIIAQYSKKSIDILIIFNYVYHCYGYTIFYKDWVKKTARARRCWIRHNRLK
jgi:hypothetical protein